jgi:hypothetical protein
MRGIAAIVLAGLVLAGCAHHSVQRATTEAQQAIEDCRQMRLNGQLPNYVASANCSGPRIIAAYQKARYRYMDLVNLYVAAQLVGSERVDKGEITEAQLQLELAELHTRLASEEQRRAVSYQHAQAAQTQANGVLLQGLSAISPHSATCQTFGTFNSAVTNCNSN